MEHDFINLTPENLANEHLCCIIRSKSVHAGIEAKRQWLSERLKEGHVFRKLNEKATVFIEYAPLEAAWVPVVGDNYYYLYCLWVEGREKGKGYGKELMEYCLADAKAKGKSGICELLALSLDGTRPRFAKNAKSGNIENKELTIYYDMQCPYIFQTVGQIKLYCEQNNIPVSLIQIDTLRKAKELPCVFNNFAVFYKGNFQTVNLLDTTSLKTLLKK